MIRIIITLAAIAVASPASAQVADPAVTQSNIADQICTEGYSAAVRPPYFLTASIKREKLRAAGLAWEDGRRFELDHVIPLCAGGAPSDPGNLRLQPWTDAKLKDADEALVCRCICEGVSTLAAGQAAMASWSPGSVKGCPKDQRAEQ